MPIYYSSQLVLAAENQLTGRRKYYMQRVDYLVIENLEEQISGIL